MPHPIGLAFMIITSDEQLELGKIYDQDTNRELVFYYMHKVIERYAFKVIRKSSKEEFISYVIEEFGISIAEHILCKDFYYEIQTD